MKYVGVRAEGITATGVNLDKGMVQGAGLIAKTYIDQKMFEINPNKANFNKVMANGGTWLQAGKGIVSDALYVADPINSLNYHFNLNLSVGEAANYSQSVINTAMIAEPAAKLGEFAANNISSLSEKMGISSESMATGLKDLWGSKQKGHIRLDLGFSRENLLKIYGEMKPASELDYIGGETDDISKAKTELNKNDNDYVGFQGVYKIEIDNSLHKYGKADMTNINAGTGNPVRLQEQLNNLERVYKDSRVDGKVLESYENISTKNIKKIETRYVQEYYDEHGVEPPDNKNHPGLKK